MRTMNNTQHHRFFFIWENANDVLVYAFEIGEFKKSTMPITVLCRLDILWESTKGTEPERKAQHRYDLYLGTINHTCLNINIQKKIIATESYINEGKDVFHRFREQAEANRDAIGEDVRSRDACKSRRVLYSISPSNRKTAPGGQKQPPGFSK